MLPDFQPRHLPDVFLPRVCADRPFAQSADRTVLVDANFVTFRCEGSLSPDALLALLHSSWAWAWLEFSGAVLGGGALKLESTILKRLPIPILTADQSRHANAIGDLIRTGYRSDAVNAIDEMLLEPMNLTRDLNNQLRSLASYRMNARTMRNI